MASAEHWFLAGLLLAGLAVYSCGCGWTTGVLWKALGAAGLAALFVGWQRRGGAALAPSLGADYRAGGGGLPSAPKLPFAGAA